MAEALYRKYRPQVFEDVVGQEPIERTLKNAISQDKVSHAYLFCGPRGTGKTTTARLLAKALICEKGPTPDPDGTCEDCRLIAEGAHPDVYELDAASRTGVENVREEIISRVHFAPTRGRYKVYIVDEVHMLSIAAFNALLKTLEEPPSHVVFVLCTTDPQKVPDTIHSRCQRFDFHRISPESMVARLGAICVAEGVEFEGEALDLIAQRADGGLRNALTSLEQIIAFENGEVTLLGAERLLGSIDSNDMAEIMAYVGKRDIANCFRWTAAYVETGADLAQFVRDMSEHVRNMYVMALVGDDAELDVNETVRRELANELTWFGPDRAARLLGVLGDLTTELKTSSNPRLAFEIALTRMVRPDSDLTLESLAERVEALESGYSAVAHVLPGEPAPARSAAGQASVSQSASEGAKTSSAPRSVEPAAASGPGAVAHPASDPFSQRVDAATSGVSSQATMETVGAERDDSRLDSQSPDSSAPVDSGVAEVPPAETTAQPQRAEGNIHRNQQPQDQGARSAQSALSNPAALQRIWQAAIADVRKRKQAHGVLFMSAKASFDSTRNMVRIAFPEESSFAFNAVQRTDVQTALEEALVHAAGEAVPFYYEKGSTQVFGQPVGANNSATGEGSAQRHDPLPVEQAPHRGVPNEQVPNERVPNEQVPNERVPYEDAPYDQVPYEDMGYDQVPYEDMGYDQVPYDEFGASYAADSRFPNGPGTASASSTHADVAAQAVRDGASVSAARAAETTQASLPQQARSPQQGVDADTAPSPAGDTLTPDGAVSDDTAALQAMLQESFGGGVIFSEADDEV